MKRCDGRLGVFCLLLGVITPTTGSAQDTVYFSRSAPGETRAMIEWGVDTAWPNPDNVRQSIYHMGADQVDVVRINFFLDETLDSDGEIGPNSKQRIDDQLALAAMAGDKPLALTPASESGTDPYYLDANGVAIPSRWLEVMEATQRYIGKPIKAVEVFNEPDFWSGYGPKETLREIFVLVAASPNFQGTELQGASTLCSCSAQEWFDAIADVVTHGTTHQLASWTGVAADNYINFIQHVQSVGDIAYNPELHSMAEVLYGCEYGMLGGIWWADALLPRGVLVTAVQGKRLGYAENWANSSAAAVYRAPSGRVFGFAGSFERSGVMRSYRFVSTDQDLYFNGIGPVREFMYPTEMDPQGGYFDIEATPSLPALDGHFWKIVNRSNGQVIEVANAGTANGDDIRLAADTGSEPQKWYVTRGRDGYYVITNAWSGKVMDLYNFSLSDGGNISQWESNGGLNQKWYFDPADSGYFFIRNGHSNKIANVASAGTSIVQQDQSTGLTEQWQFVPADPAGSGVARAQYAFDGDATDSTGAFNGTAFGSPTFKASMIGQAIEFDGVDDYISLPSDVCNTTDLTVAEWVKWNGGLAGQRIFDFGVNAGSYVALTPSNSQGLMEFSIRTNAGGLQAIQTEALPVGQWVHLAITLSGNTGILYVNGVPRTAACFTMDPGDAFTSTTQFNYIGKGQSPTYPLFGGQIDDFRVYDYALSGNDVADLVKDLVQAPEILTAPASQSVGTGGSVTLTVEASGMSELVYQWQREGIDIAGATGASYTLPSAQMFNAGAYDVVVSSSGTSVTSASANLTVQPAAPSAARLVNLSTRAQSLRGDNTLIPGFVIGGSGTKHLLVRGVGPTLASFGVGGTLADPAMELVKGSTVIASNDDWDTNSNKDDIVATAGVVGAFALLDGAKDAALLVDLAPGAYTLPTTGADGGTGIALVELYDADSGGPSAQLVNISNRGFVGEGENVMIPGIVVSSEGARTFLIRGVGPTLATFGVSGTLDDPLLTIFHGSAAILSNDDWGVGADATTTASVGASVGAFPLASASKDSAFVVTLPPGAYTVQVTGKKGATGVSLVEVYLVP